MKGISKIPALEVRPNYFSIIILRANLESRGNKQFYNGI